MLHQKIKQCFSHSVHLVSQGSASTKNELLDFFDMDPQSPTASALNQQRAKLKPDTLEAVFRHFNYYASFYDKKAAPPLSCCRWLLLYLFQ